MVIYGVALLAVCTILGIAIGEGLGRIIGIEGRYRRGSASR